MSNFITVTGRANTSAKIIADSICDGKRITTFELEYPRFVHAEFMTHRLFSRNAASSRAIPVSRMLELVTERPATFVHWGKNQAGMQANEEMDEVTRAGAKEHWRRAALQASHIAESLSILGAHKQIVNRLLEPFQMMKVVCTATEWDNFLYLRNHKDAQPEIHELASVMWEAMKKSTPEELFPGEWHTPYVDHARRGESALCPNELLYCKLDEMGLVTEWLTKEEALIVSASCCAQVSYRRQDDSLEKAK
ncbi:MAG TPA: FAD-dependent thymidylate synthase, partial [Methanosarcina sp.]|nr:FAD-dependent thymidylate synthase [Methanosarcina sp.]